MPTSKRKHCPSCGQSFSKGGRVYMLVDKALQRRTVCSRCERSAVRILIEPPLLLDAQAPARRRAATQTRKPLSPLMQHVAGDVNYCQVCGALATHAIDSVDATATMPLGTDGSWPVCDSVDCVDSLRALR